jgi:hypothetical protein
MQKIAEDEAPKKIIVKRIVAMPTQEKNVARAALCYPS